MDQLTVNGRPIDYSELPEHMQGAMQRYMEYGIEPGSFLTAVLCNDLMGAVGRADSINRDRLNDYATWLYNNAPPPSFGSREKFEAWIVERQSAIPAHAAA
jgi:hypothetical protein